MATKETAAKVIFETFKILKENGGQLSGKEIAEKIETRVSLDEREKGVYEKTGYTRRRSLLQFFSIDSVKAGFVIKRKGIWILTEEGEKAIQYGPEKLLEIAGNKYKEWKKNSHQEETIQIDNGLGNEEINEEQLHEANLDDLESRAFDGLKKFIKTKNPYEFQDIVAALLRAMGYFTPFISPKGKDGGIDIIAYQDPLGVKSPRIKVQVKHYPDTAIGAPDIRELRGLLNKDSDVGIFVTSGRFSNDAEREGRTSGHTHIELIDFTKFIELRKGFYDKLNDEEKNMLPLYPVYFLGSND